MNKSLNLVTASLALLSLLAMGVYSKKTQAQAPQQYPIVDAVAQKIVQKYQTSTCEQSWEKRSQKAPPKPEQSVVMAAAWLEIVRFILLTAIG